MLQKINQFVENFRTLLFEKQKQIALELLSLLYHHTEINKLSTHALTTYLLQFLQKWEKLSEPSAIIYQWLGFLTENEDYFSKGLALDPANQLCLNAIIELNSYKTYYATHYLDESFFLSGF